MNGVLKSLRVVSVGFEFVRTMTCQLLMDIMRKFQIFSVKNKMMDENNNNVFLLLIKGATE